MKDVIKSTILGVILVLAFVAGGSVGVATLMIKPFGHLGSILVGASFIASGIVCWGWACFARKLYEKT